MQAVRVRAEGGDAPAGGIDQCVVRAEDAESAGSVSHRRDIARVAQGVGIAERFHPDGAVALGGDGAAVAGQALLSDQDTIVIFDADRRAWQHVDRDIGAARRG
ncbi:hypothetical protein D3C78_449020 [compost metagenome]